MKITETSKDFTKQELYLMTKSPSIKTVNSVEDYTVITVIGWLTFEDVDSKGNPSELLSILGTDKNGTEVVWTCQSATFKRSFADMVEIFDNEPFPLMKISGVTKLGKDFVNCDLSH